MELAYRLLGTSLGLTHTSPPPKLSPAIQLQAAAVTSIYYPAFSALVVCHLSKGGGHSEQSEADPHTFSDLINLPIYHHCPPCTHHALLSWEQKHFMQLDC